MKNIVMAVFATIFGGVGWWVGESFGFMGAYLVSSIGTILGIYVGWRINRAYL